MRGWCRQLSARSTGRRIAPSATDERLMGGRRGLSGRLSHPVGPRAP
ncbi:MAG: hypothetical protein LBE67_09910 [Kocuria palustris]|nr:hypothetical protein [Kocuria palustris]